MSRLNKFLKDKKDIKICLINPPSPFLISKNVFMPLGLMTLSAYFKQHGYNNIELIDMLGETDINKIKAPEEIDADIYFVYLNTPNSEYAKDLIFNLRKYNNQAKFIAGGPHATVNPEDCLHFDSIVMGEGEIIGLKILRDYPNLKRMYKGENIENLDDIPFPDKTLLNIREYANNYDLRGEPTTTMVTSRGCSYGKCAFCCKYWGDNKIRYRSTQNIYDEIKEIQDTYGINGIMFFDDEFVHNRKRLIDICNLIKPLNIKWRCLSRVESIREDVVPIMADSGCVEIALGIESADQEILNGINKHIDIKKAEQACKLIQRNGIDLKGLFIIGLPGETKESIQKIDAFCKKVKFFDVDFTILSVFPGSDIHTNPEKYPGLTFRKNCKAWYKGIPGTYNTTCKINTPEMTFEELVKARDILESKYKNPQKLMKKE